MKKISVLSMFLFFLFICPVEGRSFFTPLVVILDAGHGGKDAGAINKRYQLKEKEINLEIVKMMKGKLEEEGIQVVLTRDKDQTTSLEKRSKLANQYGKAIFVSVHVDTIYGNEGGAHIIYSIHDRQGGKSKVLAQHIMNSILSRTKQVQGKRGIWSKKDEDGKDYYHVIREINTTSVIVECSYMSDKGIQVVNSRERREEMAKAIVHGILTAIEKGKILEE